MRAMFLLMTIASLASASACASLGGAPSDFGPGAARARQLAGALPAGTATGTAVPYTINETTLESGTVVREYVGPGGIVFGVSWNGPFLPDLRTLLGERYASLTGAAADKSRGRGQVNVQKDDLVIESGGHMRAWSGRAWLGSALPAGIGAEVVQ